MKFQGLNNRTYTINLNDYIIRPDNTTKKSSLHIKARDLIRATYKSYSVLEELKLPGTVCPSKKSALYLDFFLPNLMLGVEVHGPQHYTYTPYFHKSKLGWLQSLKRDEVKREWCELNEIRLVELKFSDSIEMWESQIK